MNKKFINRIIIFTIGLFALSLGYIFLINSFGKNMDIKCEDCSK